MTRNAPRFAALALGLALLLGACGSSPLVIVSGEPTMPEGAERTAGIYAAVIRQLVTEDHTFGKSDSPFDHVYVVDGAVDDAGDPMTGLDPSAKPFGPKVKAGIRKQLTDLPPLDFVSDPDSVRRGEDGMGGVVHNGVLLTLEPIDGDGDAVEVGNALWCGGLCGQWLTYEVEYVDNAWDITGTTGDSAIS